MKQVWSLGLILDDVIDDKTIIEKLINAKVRYPKVIFYNIGVPIERVKKFLKDNSEALLNLHSEVTINTRKFVFFLYDKNWWRPQRSNSEIAYRFKYQGKFDGALKEYISILKRLDRKTR
jgi:hypothetical protein